MSVCVCQNWNHTTRVHPKANDGLEVTMTDHFGSAM